VEMGLKRTANELTTEDASLGAIFRLTEDVILAAAVCPTRSSAADRIEIDGQAYKGPARSLTLQGSEGLRLVFLLLKRPKAGTLLRVFAKGARTQVLSHSVGARIADVDLGAIVAQIGAGADAVRFCRYILETGLGILRLRNDEEFQRHALKLVEVLRKSSKIIRPERIFTSSDMCRLAIIRPPETASDITGCFVCDGEKLEYLGVRRMDWTHPSYGPFSAIPLASHKLAAVRSDQRFLVLFSNAESVIVDLSASRYRLVSELPIFVKASGAPHHLLNFLATVMLGNAYEDLEVRRACEEAARMLPALPARAVELPRSLKCQIDTALLDRDGHLMVVGSWADPFDLVDRFDWIGPGGIKLDMKPRLRMLGAAKVTENSASLVERRFVASLDVPPDHVGLLQQQFEVRLHCGQVFPVVPPPPPIDARRARDLALSAIEEADVDQEIVATQFASLVKTLHVQTLEGDRVEKVVEIGERIERPEVSVIIPIYKVMEFLRYQFSAFALDPDFQRANLIFVLDSPEDSIECEERLRCFNALYGGSVSLVIHTRNIGYAPAINSGAAHALGGTLVLLNSDVVPQKPGWITSMRKRLKAEKDALAVGPMLLFEDDSIQHAGLAFRRDMRGQVFNAHPMKGFPSTYSGALEPRPVEGLTGACVLLARQTFSDVGGLSEDYVIGDYEDSDFSLKLRGLGGSLWYEPNARLYHYERQSIVRNSSYTETRASTYNRWLHGTRWQKELDRSFNKP
jgi:O-antigen biosynthesis protein